MAVDASDRKLYLMAASRSDPKERAAGKAALRNFDADLKKQSAAKAQPDKDFQLHTGSTPKESAARSQRDRDFQLHTGSSPSKKLAARSPNSTPKNNSTTEVQKKLIERGYDLGSTGADGIAGAKTKAAVMAYQRANGLAVDGIVGPQTRAALNGKTSSEATEAAQDEARDVEAARERRDAALDNVSDPNADARDEVNAIRASGKVVEESRDLHDASVEQYEAYDNQTGSSADSYGRADEGAGVSGTHDEVRERAREQVVTSIAESPHQANARMDFATRELDESTTEVDESQLPSAFDYAMLDEGPSLVDGRLKLEAERDKDRERYVTVAGNEAIFNARRNEDIETDIYAESRGAQIERASTAGVSDLTLKDVQGLTGDALVEAREADPANDNEQNSQVTADIFDAANLAGIRNILAATGDPAQTENVVNTDLLLDADVEDIADGVKDADPDTAQAFEDLIGSVGLGHEFDTRIPGVSTDASGSALATGANDADIRRALMLQDPGAILDELADYRSGRLNSDSMRTQGNYRFDRIVATDERFAELDAQLAAGISEDGSSFEQYAPSVYAAAEHMFQGAIDADMALNVWSLQRPEFTVPEDDLHQYTTPQSSADADAEDAAPTRPVVINGQVIEITEQQFNALAEQHDYTPPEAGETHTVNLTMRRYHTRQVDIYREQREELAPEIERLRNIDNPDVIEARRLGELEARDAQLEQFQFGSQNVLVMLGHGMSAYNHQQPLDRYAAEARADTQNFEVREGWAPHDDPFSVPLSTELSARDIPVHVSLENPNGELYNPAAGLHFNPYDPSPDFKPQGDGTWIYQGAPLEGQEYTYQNHSYFAGETETVSTEFGFSNLVIRRNDDGTYTLSYDVNSDAGTTSVEGALGAADTRVWNQALKVGQVHVEEMATRTRLEAVPQELTQAWRDRINSDNFRDRQTQNKDERAALDATTALEEAERVYLEDPSDENLKRLNDASLGWSAIHADYANQQAADAEDAAWAAYHRGVENRLPDTALKQLYAKAIEAGERLNETGLNESESDLTYDLRDGDSQARRAALFLEDAEQYSQSAFDGFARNSESTDVDSGKGAHDYAAKQIANVDDFDDLDPDQQEMIGKIAGEIADITGDDGGSVQSFPILREQEVDGKTQLVMDVMFRVTGKDGKSRLVDVDGRSYKDEADFRNNNKSVQAEGETLLVMPEEGEISRDENGHVKLSVGDGRIESGWEEFRRRYHVDMVVGGVGIAAGAALMATGVGSPLGVALLAVSAGTMGYGATTALLDTHDRITHGEDWHSTDNLLNYGTIAASVLPGGKLAQQGRIGIGATRSTLRSGLAFQRGNRVMALTGRNLTGSASDDFFRLSQTSLDDAALNVLGTGRGQRLINGVGATGGGIGTGMTVVDTGMLANHINQYGMEGVGWTDIALTLADLGAEVPGAVIGLRRTHQGPAVANGSAGGPNRQTGHSAHQDRNATNPNIGAVVDSKSERFGVMQDAFASAVARDGTDELVTRLDNGASVHFDRDSGNQIHARVRNESGTAVEHYRLDVDDSGSITTLYDDNALASLAAGAGREPTVDPSQPELAAGPLRSALSAGDVPATGSVDGGEHAPLGDGFRIVDRPGDAPPPVSGDGSGGESGPPDRPSGPDLPEPPDEPDWRNQIGQADPVDLLLTPEQIENRSPMKSNTAAELLRGNPSDGFVRAALEGAAGHPEIGQMADTIGYLNSPFRAERFDTLVENIRSNIEGRNADPDGNWFDTPPDGIDAEKWDALTDKEKAGFALTAEIERAIHRDYQQAKKRILAELDSYVDLLGKRLRPVDRKRIPKIYEEYRQQNGGDDLPVSVSEFLDELREKISEAKVTAEGLDYLRATTPMQRFDDRVGTPVLERRRTQFLTSAAVNTTFLVADPELRALFAGGSTIIRGGHRMASTFSERAQKYEDASFASSYGAATASTVVGTVGADPGIDAALEGVSGVTDALNTDLLARIQQVDKIFEESIYPLLHEFLSSEQAFRDASGDQAIQLEQERDKRFNDLEYYATKTLKEQRAMSRLAIPASFAGTIRVADLLDAAFQSNLGPAGKASSVFGLTLSSTAAAVRTARAGARVMSIHRQNTENRDLAGKIREAKTIKNVLDAFPRFAELQKDAIKPDGSEADDLRTWITGDKHGADGIVQVFMTRKNLGTWQIEMHVIDLQSRTTEVFNKDYKTEFFSDPVRTRKDQNYFWREHPFEKPLTFIRGATTSVEGALDVVGSDLAHPAAMGGAVTASAGTPAIIQAVRLHGAAGLKDMLIQHWKNKLKGWQHRVNEIRPGRSTSAEERPRSE